MLITKDALAGGDCHIQLSRQFSGLKKFEDLTQSRVFFMKNKTCASGNRTTL
jgi:hypothetical protein